MPAATGSDVESVVSRAANSVWGLLLARFVTPVLVAACLWLFSNYLSTLNATIAALAARVTETERGMDSLQEAVSEMEARRDVAIKARDLDIANLTNEIQLLRTKTDASTAAIAAQSARLEIVLDMLKELRSGARSQVVPPSSLSRGG